MYIKVEALSTTSRVELINKRKFTKATLDKNFKTCPMYIATLEVPTAISIYLSRTSHVKGSDKLILSALQYDKASTKIPAEYFDYADIFLRDLTIKLPKNTGINEHAIKLIEGKQPLCGPIYALSLIELETLKAYIETFQKIGFI